MKKILGTVLCLSIFLMGCNKDKGKESVKKEEKTIKTVSLEKVKAREMVEIFSSSVVLEPKDKVDHSLEKGGTVEKIYKKNGDTVKKGDLIVEFSNPLIKSLYMQASSNYDSAKSSYNIENANFKKFKILYDKELISFLEFSKYESSFIQAKGNLRVAQANLENAKSDYDKLRRKADISGVVGNLFLKVGNDVKPKETVFTILNDDEMESYVGISPKAISKVKLGDKITVKLDSIGNDLFASIVEINPIADSRTKNFKIKISLNNKDKSVKDGMYGNVFINVDTKKVLSIKDEAIFVRDLENYIYKYDENTKKVKQVLVKKGKINLPYSEIISDEIKEGDRVVVKGLFGLQDNDEVTEKM